MSMMSDGAHACAASVRRRASAADVGRRNNLGPLPGSLATVGQRLEWAAAEDRSRASRVFRHGRAAFYRHAGWPLGGLGIMAALLLPALSLHLGETRSSAQANSGPAHDALSRFSKIG